MNKKKSNGFDEKSRLLSTVRGVFSYTRIFTSKPVDLIEDFRYNSETSTHCARVQDKAALFFITLIFTDFNRQKIICREELKQFLSHFSCQILSEGYYLHDIGKPHMEDQNLFLTRETLSRQQVENIKNHTVIGEKIVESMFHKERRRFDNAELQQLSANSYRILRNIILHHHEHYDGSGYPHGLAGVEIPIEARVATLLDNHDALSNYRNYKKAWDKQEVRRYLIENRGRIFDPDLIDFIMQPGLSIDGKSLFDLFGEIDHLGHQSFRDLS